MDEDDAELAVKLGYHLRHKEPFDTIDEHGLVDIDKLARNEYSDMKRKIKIEIIV